MQEENGHTEKAQDALPEKFDSVEALAQAYRALEAEFTRRSQRLKELERAAEQAADRAEQRQAEEASFSVPLMTRTGTGVSAPPQRARSLREAGALALGYLKSKK